MSEVSIRELRRRVTTLRSCEFMKRDESAKIEARSWLTANLQKDIEELTKRLRRRIGFSIVEYTTHSRLKIHRLIVIRGKETVSQ